MRILKGVWVIFVIVSTFLIPVDSAFSAHLTGQPCNDGNQCTSNDRYSIFDTCFGDPRTGQSCDDSDGNSCTSGECSGFGVCHAIPQTGQSCDDGNQCTSGDTCTGVGTCSGTPRTGQSCSDSDGNDCTEGVCSGFGVCHAINVEDGTTCGDGPTICSKQDTCLSGVCQPNHILLGNDLIEDAPYNKCSYCQCNLGHCRLILETPDSEGKACGDDTTNTVCNPRDVCESGKCAKKLAPTGTPCGDPTSNDCTLSDACINGACHPRNAPDGRVCGDQSDTECKNPDTCISGICESNDELDNTACNDGDLCTTNDTCQGGDCTSGQPVVCDDGEFCNGQEVCLDGECIPGDDLSPDDGIACTDDSCDEDSDSIVNAPNDASCDDGNVCTADSCDAIHSCQNTPIADVSLEIDCETGLLGVCASGTEFCKSGDLTCEQNELATAEVCDELDNDCDGEIDERDGGGSVCVIPVSIDIKPGSDTNPINCKSKGNTPIAILSDGIFDATTIDTEILSLSLVSSSPISVDVTDVHNKLHAEDVDGDGALDVIVHIDTADICSLFVQESQRDDVVTIVLDSELPDGTPVQGSDDVIIKGKKILEN